MLKDVTTDCPICGQTTVLAVPVVERGDGSLHGASTRCRACHQDMMAIALPDGDVEFVRVVGEEVQRLGVRKGLVEMAEILRPAYSVWQPRGEPVTGFHHRPEVAEALGEALARMQTQPRPLSVPRRIFISYRWQDDASDDWVAKLALELEARGNVVDFDRQLARQTRPPTVPQLVARIAACHVFLAVIDPAYIERVAAGPDESRSEGWVTDEVHTALALSARGLLLLMGLWRRGDAVLSIFRAFERGKAGNTFDVREAGALKAVLDAWFVQRGKAPAKRAAGRAASALHESAAALRAGDPQAALQHAAAACEAAPALADGHAQRARAANAAAAHAQTLASARLALELDPQMDEMRLLGAAAALLLDRPLEAAELSRALIERDEKQANARMLLGWALAKRQHVPEALGHYHEALRGELPTPQLHLLAAEAQRMIDQPQEAIPWVESGLRRWPNHPRLLVQGALAALEAGQEGMAALWVGELQQHHPQDSAGGRLLQLLHQQIMGDQPPPVLIERIRRPAAHGHAVCTQCQVRVPVEWRPVRLCAACGVPRPEGEAGRDPCTVCAAAGWAWADGHHLCPFCTLMGVIKLDPAPRRGKGAKRQG